MIDFLDMDSNKLVISEFYENEKAEKYTYDTVYQRDKVWSEETKSFLIDSIMKNYPIPPIFLRMKIDADTGLTKYEVIDGKQRLTTIKDFIEGNVLLPDDFGDDKVGNSELNGASFADLDNEKFEKYKRQFWRYRIPIIFIETEDSDVVKNVFDRLNRNGVPLVPQELRHAKYGETDLYRLIDRLANEHVWRNIFDSILENERMEDAEFTSELLFVLLENQIISYTKDTLDTLYDKWNQNSLEDVEHEYRELMKYIQGLSLDYDGLKIKKVSHLYAIWVVAYLGMKQNISSESLGQGLVSFYESYMNKRDEIGVDEYKKSMSSNTKGTASRNRRIRALINALENSGIAINMTLGDTED